MTIVTRKCAWNGVVVEVAFGTYAMSRARSEDTERLCGILSNGFNFETELFRDVVRIEPDVFFGVTIRCVERLWLNWVEFRKQHIGCHCLESFAASVSTSIASWMRISSIRSDFLITAACATIIVAFCALCDHDIQQHYHHRRRHRCRYPATHQNCTKKHLCLAFYSPCFTWPYIKIWNERQIPRRTQGRCMLACLRHVKFCHM